MAEGRIINFRLSFTELEGLKILSELTGVTQADIMRRLLGAELERQREAVEAYKKTLAEAKKKVKK